MTTSIEQIKELVDNTDKFDVPVISYKEWLECFKSLIAKIESGEQFDYRGTGSLILLVDVSEMKEDEEEDYNNYCGMLRKFFGSLGYGTSPKECWEKVLSNPDLAVEPSEYRPLV